MSKNDNYIYPPLVMSNDIIWGGSGRRPRGCIVGAEIPLGGVPEEPAPLRRGRGGFRRRLPLPLLLFSELASQEPCVPYLLQEHHLQF